MSAAVHSLDWAKALESALSIGADFVPEGWKTAPELEKETGVNRHTIRVRIRRLLTEGKAEMKTFTIKRADGVRPTVHYRLL